MLGPMNFLPRLLMCYAIVSIGPALLIWFQSENLNMVLNAISHREVKLQTIFKMVRRAGRRQETTNIRPKVIMTAEKVVIKAGAFV